MKTSRNGLGLAAVILAGTACGDTYNTYNVSGDGSEDTGNRSYTCEDLTEYLIGCFRIEPSEADARRHDFTESCEDLTLDSTTEGHNYMDCCYDAQCDFTKIKNCKELVDDWKNGGS